MESDSRLQPLLLGFVLHGSHQADVQAGVAVDTLGAAFRPLTCQCYRAGARQINAAFCTALSTKAAF